MAPRRRRYSYRDIVFILSVIIMTAGALSVFIHYNTRSDDIVQIAQNPQATTQTTQAPVEQQVAASGTMELHTITNARIQIPAAGINATIIEVYLDGESWDVSTLGMNAGHLQGTAWISPAPGNIVLSGHVEMADGRRGIFAHIEQLSSGDIVILMQDDEERRYVVSDIYRADPSDLTPVYPTSEDRLTLITCDAYDFFRDSYQERVIVVAERIS